MMTMLVSVISTVLMAVGAMASSPDKTTEMRPVRFTYVAQSPLKSLVVVGQFNGWDQAKNPMHLQKDGKTWTTTIEIKPGSYQYLFCENGSRWFPDPSAPVQYDLNGNKNSLIVVVPASFEGKPGKMGDGIITEGALEHEPDRRDLMRLNKATGAAYLRTRHDDIANVYVVVKRRGRLIATEMSTVANDDLFDTWRGEFPISTSRPTSYCFKLVDGPTTLWYGPEGSSNEPKGFYQVPLQNYPLPNVPAWVKDAVFYQIFPDRFNNGDPSNDGPGVQPWGTPPTHNNRMGGDLIGIQQKLPYLHELGINALYLNPIFVSGSNHGYDTFDYMKVDPRFGTNEDLKNLVTAAHKLGMHVILDGVFNHSGTQFFAFQDLLKNQEHSKYKGWYHVLKFPVEAKPGQQTYLTFGGVWQMPKWNQANVGAQKYLLNVATYWIKYAHIDGWRLDAADEVPQWYWKKFRRVVRKADPNAYILGEEWNDPHQWLQGDEHDAAMNYPWRRAVLDFLQKKTDAAAFWQALQIVQGSVPEGAVDTQFNLLGSHDTRRILFELKGNAAMVKLAFALQMTLPGAPCVYYGDEIGMDGGPDPDDRRCFDWNDKDWTMPTFDAVKGLIADRHRYAALREGTLRLVKAKGGELVYERVLKGETVRVEINRTKMTYKVTRLR